MEDNSNMLDNAIVDGEKTKDEIFSEKASEIRQRCNNTGIEFQEKVLEEGSLMLRVNLNAGREKRSLAISSTSNANKFLAIDFENYCFLMGYEAICSYKNQVIEASIRSVTIDPLSLLSYFRGEPSTIETDETSEVVISALASSEVYPEIKIGPPSKAFYALTRSGNRGLTLKLNKIKSRRHDDAVAELNKTQIVYSFNLI